MLVLNQVRLSRVQDDWQPDKVDRKIWLYDMKGEEDRAAMDSVSFTGIEHNTGGARIVLSADAPEVLPQLVLGKRYYLALVPYEELPNTERERMDKRSIEIRKP